MLHRPLICLFFFFNDTATTEIYTLSLHDALPILRPSKSSREMAWASASGRARSRLRAARAAPLRASASCPSARARSARSEEHTSELQSQSNLVCRLLLEKKKKDVRYMSHAASY